MSDSTQKIPCTLSVVIPCYNERGTIRDIVARVREAPIERLEIIVVDNCSTDGTRDILREEIEPVVNRVIYNEENVGKSGSVRRGIAAATGDIVVVQDADLEYDPVPSYPLLAGPIVSGRADVVYGSRFKRGGGERGYAANYVANRVLTALSNVATGLRLTDMETCYKAFRREVIQSVELEEGGFGFEPEVTAKLAEAGVRVEEVAIDYAPRSNEEGKKVGLSDGFHSVWCILRYGARTRRIALGGGSLVVAFACLSLMCAVLGLASAREFQYDEAFSYLNYAQSFGLSRMTELFRGSVANNHWLNTILMNLVQRVSGQRYEEFLLRLPNVFAMALYCRIVWGMWRGRRVGALVAVLLLCGATSASFFAQARGNGLATAFVLAGLAAYDRWADSDVQRDGWLDASLLCLSLASWAITTVTFLFAPLAAWMVTRLAREHRLGCYLGRRWPLVALVACSEALVVLYSLNATAEGMPRPEFAGSLFDSVAVGLVSEYLRGGAADGLVVGLAALLAVYACATLVVFRGRIAQSCFVAPCLGWLAVLVVAKHLLGIDYPIPRLLMPEAPLALLALGEVAEWWAEWLRGRGAHGLLLLWGAAAALVAAAVVAGYVGSEVRAVRSIDNAVRDATYEAALRGSAASPTSRSPAWEFYRQQIRHRYGAELPELEWPQA